MVTEMVSNEGGCLGGENSQEGVRSQKFPQSLGAGEEMTFRGKGGLGRGSVMAGERGVVPQCPWGTALLVNPA